MRKTLATIGVVIVTIGFAACSSKPEAKGTPFVTTNRVTKANEPPQTTVPPQTVVAPSTTNTIVTSTTTGASEVDFEAARDQWVGYALMGGSAGQNIPLEVAVDDLKLGEAADPSVQSDYSAAIAALVDFEGTPDASGTPAQYANADNDQAKIDSFFGTSSTAWNRGCGASGPQKDAAANAWDTEPKNITSGVIAGPLQIAITDLRAGMESDSGDTSCYPAAIDDLESLELATGPQIAASVVDSTSAIDPTHKECDPNNIYGWEISYLNAFFPIQVVADQGILSGNGLQGTGCPI